MTAVPNSSPVRVLLVEDEAFLREAMAEVLEESGCEVISAADGSDGLAALQSDSPVDVLLSDIRLPHLTGYELAAAGRALRPNLKLILMTGFAPSVPQELEPAVFRLLQKPFRLDELPAVVEAAVAAG